MCQTEAPPMLSECRRAEPGRWLAIETSGLFGSLAVGRVDQGSCEVLDSLRLPREARSAQTLAPAIETLLRRVGWRTTQVAAIAVATGPGSFTGLRVGVVSAKAFAYAVGAAVISADSLAAIADGVELPSELSGSLWTVLDAQRRELFVARFQAGSDPQIEIEGTHRLSRQALAERLRPGDCVVGPVADSLEPVDGVRYTAAEPTAGAVLRVAWRRWLGGAADSVLALTPEYHRLSAAEEKSQP